MHPLREEPTLRQRWELLLEFWENPQLLIWHNRGSNPDVVYLKALIVQLVYRCAGALSSANSQRLVGPRTMPFPVVYPEVVGPGRLTEIASFRKSNISNDEVCILFSPDYTCTASNEILVL